MFDIENGVFILRAQPPHNGHIEMVKYMFSRCRNCLLIIGSANKENDERNPLPIKMRLKMMHEALQEHALIHDRLKIITMNDWSAEDDYMSVKTWGRYLFYNIANALNARTVTMFYSDDKEIMLNWFRGTEIEPFVDFCFIDRDKVEDGVSATLVREAILNDNVNYLSTHCPKITVSSRFEIKEILENLPKALPRK